MTQELKTKKECYPLYEKGFFGNKALAWKSLKELLADNWKNPVCIRSKKGISRSKTRFNISLENLQEEINKMIDEGIKPEEMSFNQSMPDNNLKIQGEVMLSDTGLYLLYTTIKKPMNQGLAEESLHAFGLKARAILESSLSPSSLSDLKALMDIFPNSVIEFSCYNIPVGDIPGRNAVIWEVRDY